MGNTKRCRRVRCKIVGMVILSCANLLIASCVAMSGKERFTIVVRNDTDEPIHGRVTAGLLGRELTIPADSEIQFWALRSLITETITVEIHKKRVDKLKDKR